MIKLGIVLDNAILKKRDLVSSPESSMGSSPLGCRHGKAFERILEFRTYGV